jgi:two-component system sensor histidine kinase UhpB
VLLPSHSSPPHRLAVARPDSPATRPGTRSPGLSLRLQINLIVCALTLLFVSGLLSLEVRSMRQSVSEEVVAANRVANQLLNRTVWGYAAQGTDGMLRFLEGVGRVRSNDIVLYDPQGSELYRSPPSPYKAGRFAPTWFDRLISPPPSTQSIEFPSGKLVVRANASRAVLDAWDEFIVLLGVSVALLIAVNALVFWLVGRAVRPFGRIVTALNELEGGRFDVTLPRLAGTEASAIGSAFNRMTGVLRENLENERRAARAERELSDNRELTHWVERQVERERRTIARELHDELGQSVTAIRSIATSIAQRAGAFDAESEKAARLIAEESSRLYDAMHGLIPRLAPMVLESFGLVEGLEELVERTRRSHPDVRVQLTFDIDGMRPVGEVALALYRAAQEGISNAVRHGHPGTLLLRVSLQAGDVALDVIDDGRGFDPDAPRSGSHYGLRWLAERVEELGGRLHIDAVVPRGVHLSARVPLPSSWRPA